jgi:BolA-like protein 3
MFTQLTRRALAQSLRPGHAVNAALHRGYASKQSLSEGEQAILDKLTDRFAPTAISVQDVSGVFYGAHMLVNVNVTDSGIGGCGSFYAISITSDAFKDLPTVKQHRLVNEVLKKEIEGIHGLQVSHSRLFNIEIPS